MRVLTVSAAQTIDHLRTTFVQGRTRPLAWRRQQLLRLENLMQEAENEFAEALRIDLGKGRFETVMAETGFVAAEARYARRHLRTWARRRRVPSPLMTQPARSYIRPEPKGVALIIAPWNYPVSMVFAPLVGAIAAGNAAALKPS